MLIKSFNRRRHARSGFTILEMLIAMAVTLLMMAALGRAFKLIGDTLKSSRANVELSSRLRTIAFRINDELGRGTTKMAPPRASGNGEGYFVYMDGPMTDSTTLQAAVVGTLASGGIAGISRDDSQNIMDAYFPLSRFGDLDDYLAFTAAAEENANFRGVVPAFVILYKERELAREEALRLGTSLADVNTNLPYPPPLADAVALQPTVITSKYAEIAYWMSPARDSATGLIIDNDGDAMPDVMHLRRRVLLIRPDLNSITAPFAGGLPSFTDSSGTTHFTIQSGLRPLTALHQVCDLSIRRPRSPFGEALPLTNSATGLQVIGNSLTDLTLPENRFAHVRVPERTAPLSTDFNGNNEVDFTSMPMIDVLPVEGLLALAPVAANVNAVNRALTGFLNPAYELVGGRTGEDIVLANVLGFDVRGFDLAAPVFMHVGPDGVPGSPGDDDGDGQADFADTDGSEFGYLGSDDLAITPNDPGFYDVIRGSIGSSSSAALAGTGAFVDLGYVYKAAGNVIAPLGLDASGLSGAPLQLRNNLVAYCEGPLSGFTSAGSPGLAAGDGWLVPDSLWRSGKMLMGQLNSGVRPAIFNQVTYDTWALDYETDRQNQGTIRGSFNSLGTVWAYGRKNASDDIVNTFDPRSGGDWPNQIDEGLNGIDEIGSGPGVDDLTEREAPPPLDYALPAVQVRIRIYDPVTQNIRQTMITQYFGAN
jgi:hypothetical protein